MNRLLLKPNDGWLGFKQNWSNDLLSGFLVSLIALPLCLGIAGASGFPPIMGVMTAIVGGIVVSFFAGSPLTIKGPAAGLIVIVAGCVEAMGGGEIGWHMTLGIVVVAGLVQAILGKLKVAKMIDIFPLSVVHGMLAAIGLIIMSRQLNILLGVKPALLKGKGPIELFEMLPFTVIHEIPEIAIIGFVSLGILFGMPFIKVKWVQKIPPALVALVVAILMGQYFNLSDARFDPEKPLLNPGHFSLAWNVDFSAFATHTGEALEYLLLFVLIGSLESLLSGKAIDLLDPYKRKSDHSKDLSAVGIGNAVSGILGGLPMISEIARSSANVNNGGRTRWANLFHGLFLLLFVIALTPVIKMVPMAALSAMLIYVGFRLASPKEFKHTWSIGKEQFFVFVSTVIVTLATDLLLGIFIGTLIEMLIHVINGAKIGDLFKARLNIEDHGDEIVVTAKSSLVFSNSLGWNKTLNSLPKGKSVRLLVHESSVLDHSSLKQIHHFTEDYHRDGGKFVVVGLDELRPLAKDQYSARVKKPAKK
ncbi:MAG: SulP family inorganic anion transporter [Flavobacteriales bacterium]